MTDPRSLSKTDDLCAIFVHAGAGFHSLENEAKHLLACKYAVRAGMVFLRNGGTAIDAVEIAIASLEDDPITNSGFGSNLTIHGKVEGDASIVDHYGRSGAVGAVPNVKNPIMLARKIYDQASKLQGLYRVPPNLLVGEGATDFAWNNGIVIVPDDLLITASAQERWNSWKQDISDWYSQQGQGKNVSGETTHDPSTHRCVDPIQIQLLHTFRDYDSRSKVQAELACMREAVETSDLPDGDQPRDGNSDKATSETFYPAEDSQTRDKYHDPSRCGKKPRTSAHANGGDAITDTVGAIAVDRYGNIAAGSSSGGIGMKHRGRVGPAALIGIGTHVIPVDPADPDQTSVASVTSGTGEHIASTLAASTSAYRVYFSQKILGNGMLETVTEEEALQSMIVNEFSGHTALLNSDIKGSIGIMTVKKTNDGIALYFAHNTDSFALASMSSNDELPAAVMSRNPKRGSSVPPKVAQGGLMIRPRRHIRKSTAPVPNIPQEEKMNPKKKKRFQTSQST